MAAKLIIKDLFSGQLEKINTKCVECSFWFDYARGSLLDEIAGIKNLSHARYLFRSKFFPHDYGNKDQKKMVTFVNNGGIVKGAFKNRKCMGLLSAGKYDLFPKLRSFNVFPPDKDSTFLGCIYVEPEEKGSGIEKRLLIELEKALIKKNAAAIETIGKRLDDDMDEEEFENSPLVPVKFLINNGFYIKKNDQYYPLMRLDLKSIARKFALEGLSVENLAYKKTLRNPVSIREK